MDANSFSDWGWRIPFIVSVVLLVLSVYIRLKLSETSIFLKMKEEGKGSKDPLIESFLRYPNNKYAPGTARRPSRGERSGTRASSTPYSS
jgi:hypothetical protein